MFNRSNYKIPLDEFINNALYHPKKGYYMKNIPFGKDGDFVTAPNISKIFSEMVFLWTISYWRKFYKNKKINIVELGAGNGEMMHQLVCTSKKFLEFNSKCNFIIYEKSQNLIKLQKQKLKRNNIKWIKNLDKLEDNPTIFLGNEFLDALPIKQYIKTNNVWFERYIQKKGGLYNFSNMEFNIKKVEKKLNLKISKNQKFLEISFEEYNIIKKLNKIVEKNGGCMLFIDYAYLKDKMEDTLQAVKKHKKVNIFNEVGNSDLSHLINIPYLKKMTKQLNLELVYNTQRNFLINLGILKRAEILAANKSFLEKANIYYRINRLIDRKQMGELFKVICLYKKSSKFKLGFK